SHMGQRLAHSFIAASIRRKHLRQEQPKGVRRGEQPLPKRYLSSPAKIYPILKNQRQLSQYSFLRQVGSLPLHSASADHGTLSSTGISFSFTLEIEEITRAIAKEFRLT